MQINFNTLKAGFLEYLAEQQNGSEVDATMLNSEISIFMYASEFKEYIEDELNLSSISFSTNINDIMNMEIKNGKLVNPEEEKEENSIQNEEANIENPKITTNETNTNSEINNQQLQTPIPEETDTSINIGSIEQGLTLDNTNMMANIFNDMLSDETFKNTIDFDSDGTIEQEEITNFFNTIKGYDENEENISLDDLLNASEKIKNGEFEITTPEKIEESLIQENITPIQEVTNSADNNSSSGGSGGYYDEGPVVKTLANMNKEELGTELIKAETTLKEKETNLDSILNDTDPTIKELKNNVEISYAAYQEQLGLVDNGMANEVNSLKTSIDTKENEINTKNKEIANQEKNIANNKSTYDSAVSTRMNLEEILATLKSEDTSKLNSEEIAEINAQIPEIEEKIRQAKLAEQTAKENLESSEKTLDTLNTNKQELENGLSTFNEQMGILEAKIVAQYPQIEVYLKAYKDAKQTYDTEKEKAISQAKSEIKTAQTEVDKVKEAITNYDNRQTTRDYSRDGLTDLTKNAIELAFSQLGVYEDAGDNRGSMEKYGGGAGTPWCAAFVSWLFGKGQSGEGTNNPLDYTRGVSKLMKQGQKSGYYSSAGSYTPVPGDIMIQKNNGASHTGIVVAVDGNKIYTIEGNSGNAVRKRVYTVGSGSYGKISGWIRMNEWSGGSSNIPGDTYLAYANGSESAELIKRGTR